jgi:hypothetical protein
MIKKQWNPANDEKIYTKLLEQYRDSERVIEQIVLKAEELKQKYEYLKGLTAWLRLVNNKCPECGKLASVIRSIKVDNLYLKTLKCGHKIIKRDNRV